ncbi:MAG: 6,7-dimethyl-8-ribityllumazine synthase [Crocinitomicaceae bacterium]
MATAGNNLSKYNIEDIPNGADFIIGIVVSEWNNDITGNLLEGAKTTLLKHGVKESNILIKPVPGTFELPLAAQYLYESSNTVDGVICIGSVIQGETKHFDFVCEAAALGIKDVNLKFNKPTIFCVLTDNTKQQAIDRSGGKHGNKGVEGAIACLKMLALKKSL